jgi:hypothetical protein
MQKSMSFIASAMSASVLLKGLLRLVGVGDQPQPAQHGSAGAGAWMVSFFPRDSHGK